MSQHHFTTHYKNKPVTVTIGWDRPLGHFFMFIEWKCGDVSPDDICDEPCYSTLDEVDATKAFSKDWKHIKEQLAAMEIEVPQSMFDEAEKDRWQNIGNKDVWHQADGSFSD